MSRSILSSDDDRPGVVRARTGRPPSPTRVVPGPRDVVTHATDEPAHTAVLRTNLPAPTEPKLDAPRQTPRTARARRFYGTLACGRVRMRYVLRVDGTAGVAVDVAPGDAMLAEMAAWRGGSGARAFLQRC